MIREQSQGPLSTRREGFTLAETIVGMLVGTVALIALAGVMISGSQVQGMTLSKMEMITVGERQLDQLRMAAATRSADTVGLVVPVSGTGGSLTTDVANYNQQVTSSRGRTYTVRWQVTHGLNSTRNVTVRVLNSGARSTDVSRMDFSILMLIE